MNIDRAIYLVGFSGSGKSTIAKLAAEILGCPAHDLDDIIVERAGMSIPEIFEKEGESGFRRREAEALGALGGAGAGVIATGGGAMAAAENRAAMAAHGWVIFLEARPETLLERLERHRKELGAAAIRPLLDRDRPLDHIRALKESRQSAYSLADWTIHTDRLTAMEVAREVIHAAELLEESARGGSGAGAKEGP